MCVTDLQRLGRRLLVWMVALAAMLQTLAQSAVAFVNRRADEAWIWFLTMVALVVVAASIERQEVVLEES